MAWSTPRTWSTSEVVTAAHMNQEVRDNLTTVFPDDEAGVDWNPTLKATGGDPGVSAVDGIQYRVGPVQFLWARFVLSSGGAGTYYVDLPNAAVGVVANSADGKGQVVGTLMSRDDSPGWVASASVYLHTSTVVRFVYDDIGDQAGLLTADNPRVWAADDVLSFHASYPIA